MKKSKMPSVLMQQTFVVGRDFWYFKAFFPPPSSDIKYVNQNVQLSG
jgi:hypothetical protein